MYLLLFYKKVKIELLFRVFYHTCRLLSFIFEVVAGKSPLLGRQATTQGHIGAGGSRPIKRNKRLSESMRPAIRPKLRYREFTIILYLFSNNALTR